MRKLIVILGVSLAACAGMAEPKDVPIYLAMGDATAKTGSVANVSGYIDTVYISTASGASTGIVTLAIVPKDGQTTATSIATGTVTGSKVWRPVVDRTAVAGTDLASDDPGRFIMVGDTLRLIVSSSDTGITWRASIMIDDN